ncbi:hypothetical protein GCM10011519_13430 [Marmoricola endophyticus]|uniref:Transcription termination factor Rho n=1 Tax=Marmoricola endophyticus TaxID=2040280 RepID=A0A917BH44_9ACTN|nr:transcription termination factor Rho [Marmoricola endophyticus]GGF41038.1 hypothetical protein GCM10011519_13430 [Marmoricola endophyticus]
MTESAENGRDVSAMLMPELRRVAGALGIKSAGMKKADLVAAVRGAQGGSQESGRPARQGAQSSATQQDTTPDAAANAPQGEAPARRTRKRAEPAPAATDQPQDQQPDRPDEATRTQREGHAGGDQQRGRGGRRNQQNDKQQNDKQQNDKQQNDKQQNDKQKGQDKGPKQQDARGGQSNNQGGQDQNKQDQGATAGSDDDDESGGRRNRRRRGRDRQQQGGGRTNRNEPDTNVLEDDVLLPCAGILDVLDNYAFVRTTGYLAGPDDVYVSLSMVRKLGLRPGDAISGQVRLPREGERKEKFNPLVKIDSVNGAEPELSRSRKEFGALTPLYPTERLRMETRADELIGRVIDVAAPIGKGQRGLVVSAAKAGRTTVLRAIADAVSANNPECHLMVVLIDERPEEVTDFERSVRGEVISSTFDRPPSDHTAIAELAIERAKRLVELGHDVVVLLDGVTTLGRAYNLAAPASGRTLAGGVDASALYPPKRFFGAARNIENGGSLTVIATATVESGSAMDEVILEEFEGTSTMELRLRRDLADRWLFPAVDVLRSGTRREELLLGAEEIEISRKLRRALAELEPARGLEMVLARLGHTRSNYEFLTAIQRAEDSELTTTR